MFHNPGVSIYGCNQSMNHYMNVSILFITYWAHFTFKLFYVFGYFFSWTIVCMEVDLIILILM